MSSDDDSKNDIVWFHKRPCNTEFGLTGCAACMPRVCMGRQTCTVPLYTILCACFQNKDRCILLVLSYTAEGDTIETIHVCSMLVDMVPFP